MVGVAGVDEQYVEDIIRQPVSQSGYLVGLGHFETLDCYLAGMGVREFVQIDLAVPMSRANEMPVLLRELDGHRMSQPAGGADQ